jgi:hypothetical protein
MDPKLQAMMARRLAAMNSINEDDNYVDWDDQLHANKQPARPARPARTRQSKPTVPQSDPLPAARPTSYGVEGSCDKPETEPAPAPALVLHTHKRTHARTHARTRTHTHTHTRTHTHTHTRIIAR